MDRRNALGRLAGIAALQACGSALADSGAEDDLLPEDFANRVKVNFQQTGREVEIWVANPNGRWVVTAITTTFEYRQPAAHAPDAGGTSRFYPNPEIRTWPMHLLPDKAEKLGMTLGDQSVLADLHVLEIRGRERTFFEQVQRYLF